MAEVEEGMKYFSFRMPISVWRLVQTKATETGDSANSIILKAVVKLTVDEESPEAKAVNRPD